jgi:DNA-binding response OmpR family regulator
MLPMCCSILVVDDNEAMVASVVAALTSAGYDATGVRSFRDGVRALTDAPPTLLIVGLHLGVYNGLHLLMRGRADHPSLRAIMVGPPSLFVAAEARVLGADAYLPQPLDLDALMFAVRDVLDPGVDPTHGETRPSATPTSIQLSA